MHTNKHSDSTALWKMFKAIRNEPVAHKRKCPVPCRFYQLTEIEMSVTGILRCCHFNLQEDRNGLINRDRDTDTDLSTVLPPLTPPHLKAKDNGLLHICFLKFHFFGVRIFLVHCCLCLCSKHVLYNVLFIDLDSYKYCILKGM